MKYSNTHLNSTRSILRQSLLPRRWLANKYFDLATTWSPLDDLCSSLDRYAYQVTENLASLSPINYLLFKAIHRSRVSATALHRSNNCFQSISRRIVQELFQEHSKWGETWTLSPFTLTHQLPPVRAVALTLAYNAFMQ